MKKEYISPEFKAVRFNSEDIICTSAEPTDKEQPKTMTVEQGFTVANVADQTIDVFK